MLKDNRQILITTFLYFTGVMLFAVVILRINWMLTVRPVVELFLILFFLLMLVATKPIRLFLSNLPKVHLHIFLIFFFLISSAHIIEKEKTTFPFLTWGMYCRSFSKNQINYFQYYGIEENDRRTELIVDTYFPALTHSAMYSNLDVLLRRIHSSTPVKTEKKVSPRQGIKRITARIFDLFTNPAMDIQQTKNILDRLLKAIGKEHNNKYTDARIHAIEVVLVQRGLEITPGAVGKKNVVWEVNLSDEH